MKLYKKKPWLLDSLCAVLLLILITCLLELKIPKTAVSPAQKPFTVHEIDPKFLEQAEALEHQIEIILEETQKVGIKSEFIKQLHDLSKEIKQIKAKYTKNSPALAFLGPIGTVSIVLKERDLEKKLLQATNEIGNMLNTFIIFKTGIETVFNQVHSIQEGLDFNKEKIRLITS